MTRFKVHREGEDGWTEWVQPVESGYLMRCCGCGLVHEMEFRVYEGRVQFRARRADAPPPMVFPS